MANNTLLLREVIRGFPPGQELRAALLLTYCFDGRYLEESFVPDLFDRPVGTALVIRDGNSIIHEAPTVRYHRANAKYSSRVFHPKLLLLVAENRALAVVGSANLTRGGLERNLELASSFEVCCGSGSRTCFEAILKYVEGPLLQEVSGSATAVLVDTATALGDVLKGVPKEVDSVHSFLHNYDTPIWEQVLKALPHRHVARVGIVSPFFEPNAESCEDPSDEDDTGVFARVLDDFVLEPPKGEKPITVFFQQSEGNTNLPIDKLKRWADSIELWQRLSTSVDEPRPLHGKMLIIEGAKGTNRDPYVVVVSGSPNFTSAALLSTPPSGNAEIAILSRLPARRNASVLVRSALQLDNLFGKVEDWSTLKHSSRPMRALPRQDAFRVTDVALDVGSRTVKIAWQGDTSGGTVIRLLAQKDGVWTPIASAQIGTGNELSLAVPDMLDVAPDGLVSLKSSHIRVEVMDETGSTLATVTAPVNVDCPNMFCGVHLVGQLMATLDQRIAAAGCGLSQSYRDQQDFLERHKAAERTSNRTPTVLTHQADLDRFFRNLHTGLRGIHQRVTDAPDSEYTLRRTIRDLGKWCAEALSPESKIPTRECCLFLLDRLGVEIQVALDHSRQKAPLAQKLSEAIQEAGLERAVRKAVGWINAHQDSDNVSYCAGTVKRFTRILEMLARLGVPQ